MGKNLIRVYGFFGKHPIYETIVKYPPNDVVFVNKPKAMEYERLSIYEPMHLKIKNFAKAILNKLKLPRMIFLFKAFNCDLIHSSRGFLVLNQKPWIIDFEHIGSFGAFDQERVKKISLKLLSSRNCKKILPHCYAAMHSLLNGWRIADRKIKEKIEILYPAIEAREVREKKNEITRIGFIATRAAFYEKGGREFLKAAKLLSEKYDFLEFLLKCKVPSEIKRSYNLPNVKFIEEFFKTREELFKNFYEKLDIFVLPTYVDSFGFSLLEAMSCGLPIVATDIFAIPEIIQDGKSGFLIHSELSDFTKTYVPKFFNRKWLKNTELPEIVKQLVEKLSLLIENFSLRKKMGRFGQRLIEKGKFSIKERNKKLKTIYEEALIK